MNSNHPTESGRPSTGRCLIFAAAAIVLLAVAIIIGDRLARARDPERRAAKAMQALAAGDNLTAIHDFARLLRERESDIAARYNLGAAYHNYGWHDEALTAYNNVLALANEYAARAAHSAARIRLQRGEFDMARMYYETALRNQPEAPDIRAEYEQLLQAMQPHVMAR